MQRYRGLFALAILFFALSSSEAQVAPSPVSTFGFGELYTPALAQNQGMGGVGIAAPSSWYLNNQNPALLVFNYVTVFQAGLQLEKKAINDGTSIANTGSGNLNYLAIAFPVKSGKWTTSLGLMPYSNVNYNLSYSEPVGGGGLGTVTKNSIGKGGISQFYWSNGVRLTKFLSVGVKASYLFSSINKQNTNTINLSLGNYSSIVTRDAFNGVNLSGGISFHKDSLFRKNYRINIGATYSLSSDLSVDHKVTNELYSSSGAVIDSTTFIRQSLTTTLPQNIGVGFSFGRPEKWMVAGDFLFMDYGTYHSYKNDLTGQDHRFDDRPSPAFHSAFGGEFTPDISDFTNYLKRVTYRTGVSYDQYQFLVNGNQLRDFGINFGLSLPVNRLSTIDIGVKFGRRGAVSLNTIEENYFRLYFGVTFNDNSWFIKRKFD